MLTMDITADQSTSGSYASLGDAVGSLSGTAEACIFVYPGTYTVTEQVLIAYGGPLTLYGYTIEYALLPPSGFARTSMLSLLCHH